MPYQTIDHTADLGILVQADSLEALFVEAARALPELIFGPRPFTAAANVSIRARGHDWPDLMVNWLRELLSLWNSDGLIPGPADIRQIEPFRLEATVPVDNRPWAPHDVFNEIKAVTYHQIDVSRQAAGWRARVIFDT